MSLINEALKKAQKQRTGETTPLPAIGGESAERIARRAKPAGFNTLLLYIGGGVAALAVVIIAVVFLLRKSPSAPAPVPVAVAATPAVKPPEPAAVLAAPAPTVATVSTAATTPAFVVPVVTAPAPAAPPRTEAPAPVVLTETPKLVVASASVPIAAGPTDIAPAPARPEPAKPTLPGKLEARAINYIESLHVAGIRASTTDAKVLMNDRVYRIGSIVEREMGLKLTGITANSLTFEDERGATYTRTF